MKCVYSNFFPYTGFIELKKRKKKVTDKSQLTEQLPKMFINKKGIIFCFFFISDSQEKQRISFSQCIEFQSGFFVISIHAKMTVLNPKTEAYSTSITSCRLQLVCARTGVG